MEKGQRVELEYSVFLENGKVIDSNVGGPPLSFHLGMHQILPALEDVLVDLSKGESKTVTLDPREAYGDVDPSAFKEVDSEAIPQDLRYEGAVLGVQDDEGNQYRIRVDSIAGEVAVIDFNHPLAGKTLTFQMRIIDVK
ncbi:MAG: FKBP-type peptidyl-prolyl cis-trans isomerase [Chlamydiota bacterium]